MLSGEQLGWVARDIADNLRREGRSYRWDEWPRFVAERGFHVIAVDLPEWLPAYRLDTTIVVARRLPTRLRARWVWHEIGHCLMHPGNFQFWDGLPWGHHVLAKQERQANEFASLFPVW